MVTQELIDWANGVIGRISAARKILADGNLDLVPTQKDKPSPKSSLTRTYLRSKALKVFTAALGYELNYVANTNSMEPLFDDSDVVLLESLQGKWRATRLRRQPLEEGQVVTYSSSVGTIIHVLKERLEEDGIVYWTLQGANNFLPDMSKVPEAAIKARLAGVLYGRSVRKGD